MPKPAAPTLTIDYKTSLLADVTVINLTSTDSVTSDALTDFPVTGFTVSLWLKTNSEDGNIFRYQIGTGEEAVTLSIINPSNVQVAFNGEGTITTGVCLDNDEWNHLAVTIYPGRLNHFVVEIIKNGISHYKSVGALSYTGSGLTKGGTVALGGGAKGIIAKMSEFRIWNNPRNANEVSTFMQRRLNSSFKGLFLWWGLSSASDSGNLHGSTFTPSLLCFRTLRTGRQDFMLFEWTEVSNANSYQLQIVTTDGEIIENVANLNYHDDNPYSISLTPLNKVYKAQIRAFLSDGTAGDWSIVSEAVPINLLVTDISSAYSDNQLTATWNTVDQASVYQPYINGTASGGEIASPPYQFNLTPYLDLATDTSLQVSAFSSGSYGPFSEISTPTPPSKISAVYDAGANPATLTINFNGSANTDYYLRIERKNDGRVLGTYYIRQKDGGYRVVIDSGLEDTTYTISVKGVSGGNIGAFTTMDISLQTLAGPTIRPLTQDMANHSITATYQYAGGADSYNLMISPNPSGAKYTSTTLSKTFTALSTDTEYTVTVQAVSGSNLSRWSAPRSIILGSQIPQVVGVNATSDSRGDITVNWSALSVAGMNISYSIKITGPGSYERTFPGGTGTSIVIDSGTSGVTRGQRYCVSVCGTASGQTDGPWSESSCLDAGDPPPSPPVDPPESDSKGDPVSVANGSYGYNFIALSANTVNGLNFELFYNTEILLPTDNPPGSNIPVGNRWDHVYNCCIKKSTDNKYVSVKFGNGQIYNYTVPASITGYYPIVGASNGTTLYVDTHLNYLLTKADQTKYYFDSSGVLQKIQSSIGNETRLTYKGGRLASIVDEVSGRGFSISYYSTGEDDGRIQSISLVGGTSVTVSLAYTNGDLTCFTDMNNNNIIFTYCSKSLMKTTVDVDGYTFITNTYDSCNRVVTQKDARAVADSAGYQTQFVYTDITYNGVDCLQTDVTDRMGITTTTINQKANLTTLYSKVDVGNGNIQAVYKSYNGNNQLSSYTAYEGAPIPSTTVKGNTTRMEYTGAGFIQSVTYPDGMKEHFTYDDKNNKLTEMDIYGSTITYTYYNDNTLHTITNPGGSVVTYTYKSGGFKGEIATRVDELGNVWNYKYKSNGDIDYIEDPYGNRTRYSFDNYGRLNSITVSDGSGTLIKKDVYELEEKSGRIKTQKVYFKNQPEDKAFSTQYSYTNSGLVHTETDAVGNTTTYDYNEDLFLQSITYPASDGVSDITRYLYDRENRETGVSYITSDSDTPLFTEEYTYDNINRLTSYTDGNNQVWRTSYATLKEPSSEIYNQQITYFTPPVIVKEGKPSGEKTYQRIEMHDIHGRLIASSRQHEAGATDVMTRICYDVVSQPEADGSTLKVTATLPREDDAAPENFTLVTKYNVDGMVTVETDEAGYSFNYDYNTVVDSKNGKYVKRIQTTDPTGKKYASLLDSHDNTICYTAGSGTGAINSYFRYDAVHRLVATEENFGGTSTFSRRDYAYNSEKEQVEVVVSSYGQPQATYYFNGLGQLTEDRFADGNTQYTYNRRNLLSTLTNAKGQILTYGYDIAGRFVSTTLPDSNSIDFTLDGNGNRLFTKLNKTTVNVSQTFDRINRLMTRTDLYGNRIAYEYSAANQIQSITYPDNSVVTYSYDNLQRMKMVKDFDNNHTNYSYYPNGFLKKTELPGSINVHTEFDAAGRLKSKTTVNNKMLLASGTYTFDDYGRVATSSEIVPLSGGKEIKNVAFTYEGDKLTEVNGEALSYDADGNILTIPTITDSFTYNIFNQLDSAGAYTFTYDGEGLRVESKTGTKTNRFVQDPQSYFSLRANRPYANEYLSAFGSTISPTGVSYGTKIGVNSNGNQGLSRLLAETDGTNQILSKYVYGQSLISKIDSNGTCNIYIDDFIGNVIALGDKNGNLTDRYAYGPYGEMTGNVGDTENPFRFGGMLGVMTDDTGLLYMRSRYYFPDIYRFISRDIHRGDSFNPQTLNRYSYGLGDPLQYADPTGLGFFSDAWNIIKSVGRWVVKGVAIGAGVVALGVGIGLALEASGIGGVGAGAGSGLLGRAASGWRGLGRRLTRRSGYRPRRLPTDDSGTEMAPRPDSPGLPSRTSPGLTYRGPARGVESFESVSGRGGGIRNRLPGRGRTTGQAESLESVSLSRSRPTTTHFKAE